MEPFENYSLDSQPPECQFEALGRFEQNDRIRVVLRDGRTSSGQITTVERRESSETSEDVYVQYLDYESDLRDDDSPHHAVESTRSDGECSRAELTLSYSDTGRVRRTTVGEVEWIWPGSRPLHSRNLLSRIESDFALMREMGMDESQIAAVTNCEEDEVRSALETARKKCREAKRLVDALTALDSDLLAPAYRRRKWSKRTDRS